ncbi:hypothetical protein Q8A73_013730 [Channa argus]|nr:hypothetical protein Q8A73_013730 [Channa argus]
MGDKSAGEFCCSCKQAKARLANPLGHLELETWLSQRRIEERREEGRTSARYQEALSALPGSLHGVLSKQDKKKEEEGEGKKVTVSVSKNNSLTICQQPTVGVKWCLYGCYVHSSIIPTFHRRCYWLLQSQPSVHDSLCTVCCVHMRFAGSSLSTAEQQGDWSSQSGNKKRSPYEYYEYECNSARKPEIFIHSLLSQSLGNETGDRNEDLQTVKFALADRGTEVGIIMILIRRGSEGKLHLSCRLP